jgi:hypothetical protein
VRQFRLVTGEPTTRSSRPGDNLEFPAPLALWIQRTSPARRTRSPARIVSAAATRDDVDLSPERDREPVEPWSVPAALLELDEDCAAARTRPIPAGRVDGAEQADAGDVGRGDVVQES